MDHQQYEEETRDEVRQLALLCDQDLGKRMLDLCAGKQNGEVVSTLIFMLAFTLAGNEEIDLPTRTHGTMVSLELLSSILASDLDPALQQRKH